MSAMPLAKSNVTSQSFYDYRRFAILYVDDEEKSLKYFTRAFEDQFRILTASSAKAGLEMLEAQGAEVGVLMTDQRMPGEKGTWLLEKARQLCPRVIRILATAYSDMDAAVAAVNSGAIYKYVGKPWDPHQLEATLKRALEFFLVQRERDQLLKEKMSVLHNMMIADRIVSLGLLAAGMSHHIRNSLVAVKTFLDLAPGKVQEEKLDVEGLRNPDFWKDYYQNVQGQIEKINGMLKDLWEASEPAVQFKDQIHLSNLIRQVIGAHKEAFASKNIEVICELPDNLPVFTADERKIRRLVELLMRDEIVSLPPGSRITVSVQVDTGSTPETSHVVLSVRDNGPGLPQESLRLIFDPFVVRSDSPLEYGINLMACYFIVHHHSGEIQAHSEEGQGTTFTVRLPLNANQPPSTQATGDFLQKVLLNETLWEKLIASD